MSAQCRILSLAFLTLVFLFGFSPHAAGDALRITMQPDDLGPFQPGIGGFIDLAVALEIFDAEADGIDTQGLGGIAFDIFTDTGLTIPNWSPAPTGESGIYGPADVEAFRYEWSSLPDPQFIGGYGFDGSNLGFMGTSQEDDLLGFGQALPLVWVADVQPNAPGLQPRALAGIGYGERPAGGDWLFALGEIPIPTDPGLYTVELVPSLGHYILPGIDLTVDQEGGYRGAFEDHQLLGGSFAFTVVPEPGGLLLGVIGLTLMTRRCRAGRRPIPAGSRGRDAGS